MVHTEKYLEKEKELRIALERNEFLLYYQPKVNLVTGKIEGVEALIRWNHPEKGLIPPLEFIPVAEENGLILPMGEWVLRTACIQNKRWMKSGVANIVMSVNLSVRQLYQPNLVDTVRQILKETKYPPELLELEITESMMMDKAKALDAISRLKKLGIQISLDDFGTGYSSLHYLQDFPIDKIKIDQSFVRNCESDLNNETIVKMIIEMGRNMKIKVVAEGIETKGELKFLQKNFCDFGQGYLFSRPLPAEELYLSLSSIEQIAFQEGISKEIYNQKLMQEALENTQQELSSIISQQQGMIFKVIREDDRFIYTLCGGKLMDKMGFIPEQIIGKESKDFLPTDITYEKTKYFLRAWEGEENVTYRGEINGIHYSASLSSIRKDGQVQGVIGSCVDITEKKRIADTLKDRNFKYQVITDNMLDLIGLLDKQGTVIYATSSHEKVLGYPAKQYEGNSILELIHSEDIAKIETQFFNMVKSKTSCQVELRYKHSMGGWVDVEAKITPVYDDYGELEYFIAVGRDISGRKQLIDMLSF